MTASTILVACFGFCVGLRYNISILVLALLGIAAYLLALASLFSSGAATTLLALTLVSIALQSGYVAGAASRYVIPRLSTRGKRSLEGTS